MTIKDNLERICELEARIAELQAEQGELRREMLSVALDQLEEQGAAPTWRTPTGTVGLVVGQPSHAVVDMEALCAYVDGYWSEGVETVRRVTDVALKELLAQCQWSETNGAFITTHGERVPGLVMKQRPPYLSVRLKKEAKLAAAIDQAEEAVETP